MIGGETGSRTRDVDLARINCGPPPSPSSRSGNYPENACIFGQMFPERECALHACRALRIMVVPAIRIERIYSALQADVSTTITTRAHWSGRWEIEPIVPTLATWCSAIELRPRDWWAGTESNGHRLCGAFTAPWARQCPACPNWLRERDSNTRFVVMSHVRGLVTAPSSRVKGARL